MPRTDLVLRAASRISAYFPVRIALGVVFAITAACGGGSNSGPASSGTPPSALSYPSPQTYTVGAAITPLSPTVTGTVASYAIAPDLPDGLQINPTTGQITGTPTTVAAAAMTVVTALNSAGSTTFDLSITIVPPAPSALSYPSPQIFVIGLPITALNPKVSGTVTQYSVAPALPAGLVLDAASGQISGTPAALAAAGNYTVTATNSGGSTSFSLSIAVVIAAPSGLSYPSPQNYIQGTPIVPLSPTVTGSVTGYAATPALPAGLSINPSTGVISGTPTAVTAQGNYQITASNSSGSATFPLSLSVAVPPPSALSYASPQTYIAGKAIAPLNPTVSGIVTSYSVNPALPSGLTLDALSGQIAGTPNTAAPAASYTITAANGSGAASFNLSITVQIAPPSALTYHSPQTFHAGVAITPLFPRVTGSVAGYSVLPALPGGLSLNSLTGQITGTPTVAAPAAVYTVSATNISGSTSFALSITVILQAPASLEYPSPQTYALDTPIIPLSPSVVGKVSTYSVLPALPAGLSLNGSTGQISGTPTAATAATTYTITAANSAGSAAFGLSIAVVAVGVSPASISRLVASGTPVVVALTVNSQSFVPPAAVYSKATDADNVFSAAVSVAASGNSYVFSLTVSTAIAPGHYSNSVVLSLCSDASCVTPLAPASITVPYDIYVLSASSAWAGNHATALTPWSGAPDWTMYQGNAAHTGFVPVTLDPNSFSTRWQGPTLNDASGYSDFAQTVTTSDGQIYIGYSNVLYALNESDSSQIWQYSFASLQFPSVNPPSVANGTVYVAAGQQSSTYLFAFDAVNGSLVFKSAMSSQWENYLAPTIGAKGVYTNAGTYGGLYAFDFTGTQLFFENLAQTSQWTPAVDANHVYSYTGTLSVVDPVTGAMQASIADPSFTNYTYVIGGSVVLGASGSVFAANYENSFLNGGGIGNTLLDFDVNAQSIAWQVSGDYPTTPAYNAGTLYVANNNPMRLEARAESGGALLWSWVPPQAGDTSFVSEVLLTNNMAFVSTNLAVYGIDLTTHATVFSYPFIGRLALSRNGILYIQGVGPLTAINLK
jgi:PQQ-like domain/Putative Ig domain